MEVELEIPTWGEEQLVSAKAMLAPKLAAGGVVVAMTGSPGSCA